MRLLALCFFVLTVFLVILYEREASERQFHRVTESEEAESPMASQTDSEFGTPTENFKDPHIANMEHEPEGVRASDDNSSLDEIDSSGETELAFALEKSKGGRAIWELLRLTKEMHSDENAFQKQQSFLENLQARPDYVESLLLAYDSLRSKPNVGVELAGILELLKGSALERREMRDLAEREMVNRVSKEVPLPNDAENLSELNASLSTDETMILPIVAHEIFLDMVATDQERFDGTLAALRSQANHNVRSSIFENYLRTNIDRRNELMTRAQEFGIVIPGFDDLTGHRSRAESH